MTLQCHDHHDIIIYPLINKEFHFRKVSDQLAPISFCLLDYSTYSLVFTEVYQIFTSFIFNNFLTFFFITMPKNSRPSKKTYFYNTSQAENRYREREEAA